MATNDTKKRLALAIIDFLSTSLKDGTVSAEDGESVEIAQQCIADTFHVDLTDKAAMQDAIGSQTLLSIYGVYEKLKGGKSGAAGVGAASSSTAPQGAAANASTAKPASPSAPNPEAEALKSKGNAAMQQKDYAKAIDFYTQALALSPLNHIYLSNRAAAYSASHQHAEAAEDAEMATAADPTYSKAWSRLGLARFALGEPRKAMDAYQKGIDAEGSGGSEAMRRGYETAKKRLEETEGEADEEDDIGAPDATRGAPGAGAGGMPDLSSLAGMFGGGGAGGGGGGMPDLGSMMSNPMFSNMAQKLMSNPDMMNNLMSNPRLRQMAESFGGGAGRGGGEGGAGGGTGMPDLAGMMNDPSIAEMARNFMGDAGGAGRGAGAGRGGAGQ